MSFDLFFCWERQESINFESVCSWAKAFGYFERKHLQLWYANEDTGVYFSLDFAGEASADTEGPEIPQGYFDTGLSFNLNFNRPSYFGYEAMPIVENLAGRFGLSVFDQQAPDAEHLLLRVVNGNDLLQSWLESNRNAIVTLIEQAGLAQPAQMPLSKSLYRWNYAREKKTLHAKLGGEIFVPTLSPIRRSGANQVQLAFAYTQGVPCLVPQSDWVLAVRKRKAHFWSATQPEVGVLTAYRFRELVGGMLRDFDSDQLSLQVLPTRVTSEIAKLIQTCEFEYPREEFEILPLDGFVDVEFMPRVAPN
jgi:hypothetical protein